MAGWGTLPVQPTLFVGRQGESVEIVDLVKTGRLVSLVGPPGCGKTRLAVEVAGRLASRFPAGVRFVELAPIGNSESIASAVGAALGVPEEPGRPMDDVLVDVLSKTEAEPLLVVLDNCEHLVAVVALLAQRLLDACAALRLLTTSRTALGVPGERVWRVPPLDSVSAVELFVDRVDGLGGQDGKEARTVIEGICDRLDRLPLAVELTAAWTRLLSPGQILERLSRPQREFPRRGGGWVPRHDTMATAVEWSYRLLPAEAQRLFRQVSVFAGSFDLLAMEAVASAGEVAGDLVGDRAVDPGDDVLAAMVVLVDNSLVVARSSPGGPVRYRMLEPVRQHAQALLAATDGDDATEVRRRHFDHYLALVERYDPWREREGTTSVTRDQLAQEEGNLLAAFEWARRQPSDLGLRLVVAWAAYIASAGRLNDGLRWLEETMAKGTDDLRLRAHARRETGYLAWRQGDYDAARPHLEEALTLARSLDDPFLCLHTLPALSAVEFSVGDHEPALRHAREALDIARAQGDELHAARALIALAWACYGKGNLEAGDDASRAACEANWQFGNASVIAYGNFGMAYSAAIAGNLQAQRDHLAAALIAIDQGGIVDKADWLGVGAMLAVGEGRFQAGLRLLGGTAALGQRRGGSKYPSQLDRPFAAAFDPVWQEVSAELGTQLMALGRQMSWDELAAEALAEPEGVTSPLTPREQEVAELVAEGLSNVDIAQRLYISRRTVESHIDHIRQKLGVRRGEIPMWVLRDAPGSRST